MQAVVSGITTCFHVLFPSPGQITHVLLTRPPLPSTRRWPFARLACLKRAASVRSEPGSNSPSSIRPAETGRAFLTLVLSCRSLNEHRLNNSPLLFSFYLFRIDRSTTLLMLKNCFSSLPSLFPSLIYLLKIICYASFACPIKLTQIMGICQQKFKKIFHFFLFCRYFLFRKQNKTHTRRSAMTLAKESPP